MLQPIREMRIARPLAAELTNIRSGSHRTVVRVIRSLSTLFRDGWCSIVGLFPRSTGSFVARVRRVASAGACRQPNNPPRGAAGVPARVWRPRSMAPTGTGTHPPSLQRFAAKESQKLDRRQCPVANLRHLSALVRMGAVLLPPAGGEMSNVDHDQCNNRLQETKIR
ncbi:hypothetical protein [Micromonospora sp. NPDC023888]|uniref:hypothetical protein n=1 Tax=Micromonospora sp. NPDC023888 TaxID=3155607 RepID=UPI0033FC0BAF